jgi:hypothetical protein
MIILILRFLIDHLKRESAFSCPFCHSPTGSLFDYLFFLLIGAIPLLIYGTVSGTVFPFQPSFLLSLGFLIGTVVQLLLGSALFVPAELTVRRSGSARHSFLSALIAASYAYLIATLSLSIYSLTTLGNWQQLTNPEKTDLFFDSCAFTSSPGAS